MKKEITLAMLAALLVGCSADRTPAGGGDLPPSKLVATGEMREAHLTVRMLPDRPFLVGSMTVCIDGPSEVRVDTLGDGITVEDFDLRPNPFLNEGTMIGFERGSLGRHDMTSAAGAELGIQCGADEDFYELVVQMNSGSRDGTIDGYRLTYRSGGVERQLTIRYAATSCVDLSSPDCADAPAL